MEITPAFVKKVAYPALAVAAAAAFNSCDRESPFFMQRTAGEPQPLGGDVPMPAPPLPTPPEDSSQGIPGEPPVDSSRMQPEE